ncbi:MAG TPA: crossover junction endodeoxyribonuclease RuvC [Longimicrobiales bacterium]|nr:crossover junction endodeoxyribonuclease RuvC [Longimicrobiales bacterium]
MKILGVDPGTAATGYGVVVRDNGGPGTLVECGVVRTTASQDLPVRLREIRDGLAEVMERHAPDLVAVESIFYGRNVRTTVLLGHARGVILLAAAERGLEVADYSPAEIKNAIVGTGRATKEQVQFMVKKLLRLKEVPRPADAADGVAVALCHLNTGRLRDMARGRGPDGTGGLNGRRGAGRSPGGVP